MAAVFTDSNFDTEVLKADKLSVIDFWAPWCGPCLALGPTIDALSKDYEGKVNVGKVNVDENTESALELGIRSVPTVLIYNGQELVNRSIGANVDSVYKKILDTL